MSPSTNLARLLGDQDSRALIEQAQAIHQARVDLARTDYNEFAEFVLKDEQTGETLRQSWTHELWTTVRRKHKRAVIIAHTEAGKSQQFSIGVPLHELGMNPRGRYAVVSRTQKQAIKIMKASAKYIEKSDALHELFPELVPGEQWNHDGLYIRRPEGIKEPSLQALGYKGAISGARLDGVILDDFLDSTNTRTKGRRDDAESWFFSEIVSRLTEDAWVYFIGNAWHPDDLYCRLEQMGWPTYRFPVMVTDQLSKDHPLLLKPKSAGGFGSKLGEPTWPARWSIKRIEERREVLPPIEFARAMMCEARDDSDARFKRDWLQLALDKGSDLPVCHTIEDFLAWDDPDYDETTPEGLRNSALWTEKMLNGDPEDNPFWVVTGVDLSTGKADDLTALVTVAIDRITHKRFVLAVESGRWQVNEIIARVEAQHQRYGGLFIVENNAAQDYILQLLRSRTAIPVYPHTTTKMKNDPLHGVELIAAELFNEKWIFPSKNGQGATPDIEALIQEMLFYSPDPKAHTGDRLMAMWFAQTLANRLAKRQAHGQGKRGGLLVI